MTAGNHEGSVWTSYTDDDKAFWRGLRGELVREGFPSAALRKHKLLIKSYIQELGERGVFDQQEELDSDNQYLEALDCTQPLPEDLLSDPKQVIDEKSSTGDFEHTEHEHSEQSSLEDESGDSHSPERSIESQQDPYSHTLPIPVECVVSFPSSVLSEVDTSDYSPALGAHQSSLPCSQHAACERQESMLAQLDQPDIASVKSTETKDCLSRLECDTRISRRPQRRPLPVQIEDILGEDFLPGAHHNTWSEPADVTNTRSNGIDNLSSQDQSSQLNTASEFPLDEIESPETRFVFYRDVENWVEQLRPINRGRVLERAPVPRTLKEIVDQTTTTSQEGQASSNEARRSYSCECEFNSIGESSLECSQPYDSPAHRFINPLRPKILSHESQPANRSNSSKSPTSSYTDLVPMIPKIPPRDIKPTYLGSSLGRLLRTYPDELLNDTIICSHFQNLTPSDLKNFPESVQDAFIKQKTYTWEMPRDFGSRAYSVRHLAHLPSLPRKLKGCLHRTSTERLVSYTLVPDISSDSCFFYFRLRHMDNVLSAWQWHDSVEGVEAVEGFNARRPPSPVAVASVSPAHKSPYYVSRGGL